MAEFTLPQKKRIGKLILFLPLIFSIFISPSHAYVDRGLVKDGFASKWAVMALEDMYSFRYSEHEEHFKNVQELYPSDEGWSDFQSAFSRSRLLDVIKDGNMMMFGFNRYDEKVIVTEEKIEELHAAVELKVPFHVGRAGGGIRRGKVDKILITLQMNGIRNTEREYITDTGLNIPVYDYKIISYKAENYENKAQPKTGTWLNSLFQKIQK